MRSVSNKRILTIIVSIGWSLIAITGYENSFGYMPMAQSQIVRITHSKNDDIVKYPSLSNDGEKLLFVSERRDHSDSATSIKSIKLIDTDGTDEKILFQDRTVKAPSPYNQSYLCCGTRPPHLSGNGNKAVFTLSVDKPFALNDHFLGIINTDGTGLTVKELPNEALMSIDWQEKGFKDNTWDRISNYAMSNDGSKVVLLVKGHRGPRKFGFPSGIIIILSDGSKPRPLLTPDFGKNGWGWTEYPCKPYTEGGWAFAFSGNGEKILFGAQSSGETEDYDLYLINWDGSGIKKVTSFSDRFFSMADISEAGEKIIFFYTGKKQQGIGTYLVNADGTGLEYLRSKVTDPIIFEDMTPLGHKIFYRHKYLGVVMDLANRSERLVLHPKTVGYACGGESFMDFPYFPSFWNARVMTEDKIIVTGIPEGRSSRELYVLTFTSGDNE